MKKLLLSLCLLAMTSTSHAIIGRMGASTHLKYDGTVASESVEKIFINVKASAAIAAGQVAAWDLTADDGGTVLVNPVTGLAPACIMVATCASGSLCKCQIYGLNESVLFSSADGSSVAGHKVTFASGNAGYIAARATDLATEPSLGFFYDSASASASVQVFINM